MIAWDYDDEAPVDVRFRAETEHAPTFTALIEAKGFATSAHAQCCLEQVREHEARTGIER
jgi:hypothetical protein